MSHTAVFQPESEDEGNWGAVVRWGGGGFLDSAGALR